MNVSYYNHRTYVISYEGKIFIVKKYTQNPFNLCCLLEMNVEIQILLKSLILKLGR